MVSKSVLILQNEIMEYRKPLYNGLAEHYEVVVLHSGQPSLQAGDRYSEVIAPKRQLWRFHLQPCSSISKLIKDFDVVIAMFDLFWPCYLMPLLRRKRPRYVLWGHRYGSNMLSCIARDLLMSRADRLLMYGDEDLERMIARGIDASKIVIAWNTTHVPNHRNYSDAQKTSLLFVGRLQDRKRIDLVIEIFAQLQGRLSGQITLDIIGGGEIESKLKRIADNLDISHKVNFHGRIDDPEILADMFSRAYAYVSPGAVGLGVLHSLAYGVPVITLRDEHHGPEFYNLMHEHNALICEGEVDFGKAIFRICAEVSLAKRLSNNAYEYYIHERSLSRMLDGFKMVIEQ